MKEWKYLIGSADDFIGAPEWATALTKNNEGELAWDEGVTNSPGLRYMWCDDSNILTDGDDNEESSQVYDSSCDGSALNGVIAQRTESFGNAIDLEFCKANPDHPDCKCKEESKVSDKNIGTLTYKVGLDLSELYGQSEALADALRNFKVNVVNNSSDSIDLQVSIDDEVATTYYSKRAAHLAKKNKYARICKGMPVDVYDVLQAFAVTNPATQHAIKKLLCAGLRGHKDKTQDLTEALKSIERAIELEKE